MAISNRSWARFFARIIAGLMFFMPGAYKVFQMGAIAHARDLFVEPYRDTFLPVWSLWLTGTVIPFVELIAGAMLIIGFRVRMAAIVLGFDVTIVVFGHLLAEPFYAFQTHVMPRLILLLAVLFLDVPDRLAVDGWLDRPESDVRRVS